MPPPAPQSEPWTTPEVVARFSTSTPNEVLMRVEGSERKNAKEKYLLDIGCGAGSNAVPLALAGWNVLGLDLSLPMLDAARLRTKEAELVLRTDSEAAVPPLKRNIAPSKNILISST